jgi:hypothetical protein
MGLIWAMGLDPCSVQLRNCVNQVDMCIVSSVGLVV